MLNAALYFVLYARQQTTTSSTANQQQQQSPNDPKQGQRTQGTIKNTDRHADREGCGGARSPDRPPLVSCVLPKRKRRSRLVAALNITGRSVRRPSSRACPPRARHWSDGKSPFRAKCPCRCPECGSWRSRPPRRRSHSLAAASRLARVDRHHVSSQVPCRDTRVSETDSDSASGEKPCARFVKL